MALRDPGAPRRNPLFTVDDDGDGDGEPDAPQGPGSDDDGWDDWADDPVFGRARDPLAGAPGSAVGPLLAALGEAGPEAAEHLVNAAHELTLAVKVVVDAFERTLAEQRAVFAAEHEGDGGPGAPRVQNIDIE